MRQLLILIIALFVACEKNDCESSSTDFSGQSYISINGALIGISLTKSETYYPLSLASDSYNLLDVNIDPAYSISIDGVEYENGENYQLNVDELSTDIDLAIKIKNEQSGEILTSHLATLPQSHMIGDVVVNDPESGFYYLAYNNSIFKMSTAGEVVYYKMVNDVTYFNRTEVDGVVYYSYLEEIFSDEFDNVDLTGSLRCQAVVMDEHYQEIDVVKAIIATDGVDALPLDNHQFEIIDLGHYIVSAYNEKMVYNIPGYSDGVNVIEAVIQEIKDGELLFNWQSCDHLELYDMFTLSDYDYDTEYIDYVHFNCARIDPSDDNFVASFRAINSIIKINRTSGEIMWILGGEGDMFGLEGDEFMRGQHDVRPLGDGVYTVFNNNNNMGATYPMPDLAGLVSGTIKYYLNEENLTLLDCERYDGVALAVAEGSAQEFDMGHYVMCWGMTYDSEYIFTEENFITGELYFGLKKISDMDAYKVLKYSK